MGPYACGLVGQGWPVLGLVSFPAAVSLFRRTAGVELVYVCRFQPDWRDWSLPYAARVFVSCGGEGGRSTIHVFHGGIT